MGFGTKLVGNDNAWLYDCSFTERLFKMSKIYLFIFKARNSNTKNIESVWIVHGNESSAANLINIKLINLYLKGL